MSASLCVCVRVCTGVSVTCTRLSVCTWMETYSVSVNTTQPDRTVSAARKDSKPGPGKQDLIYPHQTDHQTHVSNAHITQNKSDIHNIYTDQNTQVLDTNTLEIHI